MPVRQLPVEVTRRILHEAIWGEKSAIVECQARCDVLWLVSQTWHAIVAELRWRTVALPLFDLQHVEEISRFFPSKESVKDVRDLRIINGPQGEIFFYDSNLFDRILDETVDLLEQPGWRLRSFYLYHVCISYGPAPTIAETLPAFFQQPSLSTHLRRVHLVWHADSSSFLPVLSSLAHLASVSSVELFFEQSDDLDEEELEAFKPEQQWGKLREIKLTAVVDFPGMTEAIVRMISPSAPLEKFSSDRMCHEGLFATLCTFPTLQDLELDQVLHRIGYGTILPALSAIPSSLFYVRLVLASVKPPSDLDIDPPPLTSIMALLPLHLNEFQLYLAALAREGVEFIKHTDLEFTKSQEYDSTTLAFFPTPNREADGRIFRRFWGLKTGQATEWCEGPLNPEGWESSSERDEEDSQAEEAD